MGRLDVAGSAKTHHVTGPGGEVVVLKAMRDGYPDFAADMSARLENAGGHSGLISQRATVASL